MATRRKRRRRESRGKPRKWLVYVAVLGLGVAIGLYGLMSRSSFIEYMRQMIQPAPQSSADDATPPSPEEVAPEPQDTSQPEDVDDEEPVAPEEPTSEDDQKPTLTDETDEDETDIPDKETDDGPEPAVQEDEEPADGGSRPARPRGEDSGISAANPYAGEFYFTGPKCNTPAMIKQWGEWVKRLAAERDVEDFLEAMDMRIRECAPGLIGGSRLNYASYRHYKNLQQAVDICYLAKSMGPEELARFLTPPRTRGEVDPRGSSESFFLWLVNDKSRPLHQFLIAYKLNSAKPQSLPYALRTFHSIWKRTKPANRAAYLQLAIACSLVYEERATSPSNLRDTDEPTLSIVELYDYFLEQNEKRRLLTDIKKLSASSLLHVVDVRLPRSEFDWVHKKMNYSRGEWGAAYGDLEYMMERATEGKDPYESYTFEELKKLGGICMDQAYYAANTAKCMGIPAAIAVGDGSRGGHAWVNLMATDQDWISVGSYGYKTGRFINYCSGETEHESALLDKQIRYPDSKIGPAAESMILADYLLTVDCYKQALGAVRYVTLAYPLLTVGWKNMVEIMAAGEDANKPRAADWKRLYNELEKAGGKNSELLELAQTVQSDQVLAGKNMASRLRELKRSGRKMTKSVGEGREELMLSTVERQARLYLETGDYHSLATFFRQQLKQYSGDGSVFLQVLQLYSRMLAQEPVVQREGISEAKAEADKLSRWRTCARDADKIYSKLAFPNDDYFRVQKDASIMNAIAGIYKLAGDKKRADSISKDAEKRLERARKNAH